MTEGIRTREQSQPAGREYTAYPRQFSAWRWYKPVLVLLLFAAFYFAFSTVATLAGGVVAGNVMDYLNSLMGGYDTFDVYSSAGALGVLGSVAVMLPALALAGLIVRDRPWSSYSSAWGGWRWPVFGVCMAVGLVIYGLPTAVPSLIEGPSGSVEFTLGGFLLLTVLGPLQCVAEEYCFRGLVMQSLGSWFRLPVLAIVLQAAAFAALHPYNIFGVITIVFTGLAFGAAAWLTGGLEASCAMHIVNNMTAFYFTGFGYGEVGSEIFVPGMLFSIVIDALALAVLAILRKKTGLFTRMQRDDIAPFEARRQRKKERKITALELRQDSELVRARPADVPEETDRKGTEDL
ncbi:MAG: CPBP family intramembrane metalloprotease [Oscillospiraceae bacterium]|nr:CPBP family intramembrane metalloprotease [Oscillospiraceae bacterium]